MLNRSRRRQSCHRPRRQDWRVYVAFPREVTDDQLDALFGAAQTACEGLGPSVGGTAGRTSIIVSTFASGWADAAAIMLPAVATALAVAGLDDLEPALVEFERID